MVLRFFGSNGFRVDETYTLSKLGEHLQEDGERLMRIATYYVNKSKEKADYSKITSGGIDETSRKKGHNYLTTFVNFKTKKYLV
ncbi:MAG: hypothetical protein Q9M97_08565 [Candidatus Gracilibacteria bacterium]|nr:hypothetical protein [Candidatus Gracilibacteria bacterium]